MLTASAAAPGRTAPAARTYTLGNAPMLLSWAASSGATHYDIDHLTTGSGAGNRPLETGIPSTAFSDPGPSSRPTYYDHVAAVNSAGQSGKSREVSAGITIAEISIFPDDGLRQLHLE
jgi:cellulose 1,4-beta-cellobiosidase